MCERCFVQYNAIITYIPQTVAKIAAGKNKDSGNGLENSAIKKPITIAGQKMPMNIVDFHDLLRSNTFPGKGTLEIWKELVPQNKFKSISVEDLLDTIVRQVGSGNQKWVDYLGIRYDWKTFIK